MRVLFFVIILFLSFVLIDAITTAKMENLYDTLGISEQATLKEIKKAYRKLAQEYHPDKTITKKSAGKVNDEAIFTKLTHAYEVLSDPAKKREYDDNLERFRNGDDIDEEWGDYEEFESKLTVLHVLVIGIGVFTALQYYYFHRSYNAAYKDAYESSVYQNKLEIFEMKKRELLRRGATEEANFLQPPMVYVEDRKQPNWRDLYLVQFFTLPYFLYVWNQKRIKRKEDAVKEAEKIKDWNILSNQQKKEYLIRQEEKLRRRELRREEDEIRKRREQAEEQEKIENKKKESQLLQEHENKLKKLRNDLRQICESYNVEQEKIEFLCLYLNSERLNTLLPLLKSNKKEGLSLLESTIEKIKEEREKYQDNGKKKRNSKAIKEEETEKEWSNEELKLLAQSAIKYPIGTKERLQKIAYYMKTNRSEKEIANKMKKMNEAKVDTKDFQRVENRFTKKGIVDTGPKEVSGLEEEEYSNKNGSDSKISNNSEKKTSEPSTSTSNEDVSNWSTQEHSLFEKALEKYNDSKDPKRWENISKMVSTRSVKQCKGRYKFIVEQLKKQKAN